MQTCRKPRNIKYHNQRLVLGLLRENSVMTAGELSEQIHLSVTTITKILAELQARGLVCSMGKGSSTEEGGKKPELFALYRAYRHVISVTAGRSGLRWALLDLKCEVMEAGEREYHEPANYHRCMEDVAGAVRMLLAENELKAGDICGLAVGFEGIVDKAKGVLRFPIHNQEWGRDLPAKHDLEKLLPDFKDIEIDNGVRFAGYAELCVHPEYAGSRVVAISNGSSTGGCVLENGELLEGANGFVGEVGHIQVCEDTGRRCGCGGCGCFETAVSPEALLTYAVQEAAAFPDSELAGRARARTLVYQDILKGAAWGEPCACAAVTKAVQYFSMLIRDIILLYDPHVIILQGIYTMAGDFFLESLREQVRLSPFFHIEHGLEIVFSTLNFEQAAYMGGALYCIDRYFATEKWLEENLEK